MAPDAAVPLKTTPLHAAHLAAGGRMVAFGGYDLPVHYATGIMAEHRWTREHAGLFDVSHMGPCFLRLTATSGDPAADHAAIAGVLERLVCGDLQALTPGQLRYTLLLNADGGIIDDLIVGRDPDMAGALYVVVNAATKNNDFALMTAALGSRGVLEREDDNGLVALQGPEAAAALARIVPDVASLSFMTCRRFHWHGTTLLISRSGYTGEDGFEILVPPAHAQTLWHALLADERVRPIGLGARDSLRLEAALPLYGHELDPTVSPIEAGLGFTINKRRREAADFPGARRILEERDGSRTRERVGLLVEGAPAREGAPILDATGQVIGTVTSGGFAPTLNQAIALGFVPPAHAAPGSLLQVSVRGRAQPARVVPLPFVPHRYHRSR